LLRVIENVPVLHGANETGDETKKNQKMNHNPTDLPENVTRGFSGLGWKITLVNSKKNIFKERTIMLQIKSNSVKIYVHRPSG
jgi:hypothetical protein